jgi:hypothetical protein
VLRKDEVLDGMFQPRCYVFVTLYPCFDLHYRVLTTLLAVRLFEKMKLGYEGVKIELWDL